MHCWTDLGQVPPGFGPSVVTLGNFDGVHLGHRRVLGRMVAEARAAGAQSVAVTFDPHPRRLHQPDREPELITGVRDKLELLAETGLDAVLVQPYTWEFAKQSPEEFVRRYLVDSIHATRVVVGRDIRFGWQNAGDLSAMLVLGEHFGFSVTVIEDNGPFSPGGRPPGTPDARSDDPASGRGVSPGGRPPGTPDEHRRWSSTWVRELLAAGDVAEAARILGRPHRVRGVVVRGDARGRELGFPTANLAADASGMVPADGVYAGWLTRTAGREPVPSARMPAAISIGTNPTFGGQVRRVEAHAIDRDDIDLYDDEVLVEFVERLRPTLTFDSIDDLVTTIRSDVTTTRTLLTSR